MNTNLIFFEIRALNEGIKNDALFLKAGETFCCIFSN